MLAVMSAAFGFAVNAHTSLVTNYFNDVLLLSGPQFGYITAVREIGGFVLIFLTALFYRISLQKLTAGALVVLAVGYALFSLADSFWSVVPWVLVTSFGMHTVLQTQTALAMSLTTVGRSGSILGRIGAIGQGGTMAALVMIILIFKFDWLSYGTTFVILGVRCFIGALAIVRFPHLHEGQPRRTAPKREPIVWSRHYRLYYWMCMLDGARQQVFFSFGLWVLVNRFHLGVSQIALVMLAVTVACMLTTPRLGRAVDRHGERRVLSIVNLAYVVALVGFALANNVILACVFYCIYAVIAPVVVHRRLDLSSKDLRPRRPRGEPGHGTDHLSRHGRSRAGGRRLHPQLRRLPGTLLPRLRSRGGGLLRHPAARPRHAEMPGAHRCRPGQRAAGRRRTVRRGPLPARHS